MAVDKSQGTDDAPNKLLERKNKHRVAAAMFYYAIVSGPMLVVNKVTVHYLPVPIFNLICQLATSAVFVRSASLFGIVKSEPLQVHKVKKFAPLALVFVGVIFCNMKTIQYANVETFITFRSSTPLVISFCDYIFLGRELPSPRSWCCLLALLSGAVGYVMTDSGFRVEAYVWIALWYICFTIDIVYMKHVCDTTKMTDWGRVYYTNFLALVPLLLAFPLMNEAVFLRQNVWTSHQVVPLLLSCLCGLGMSHATYVLRNLVSATTFTVVGIMCKLSTVIINCMLWEQHANTSGISFLVVCLLAGTFYKQPPKRKAQQCS